MRYGELFAGVGGLSLGLDRAGLECAFHAEIADFPRQVLKARWPNVPLYGDVATLTGEQLVRECGEIDLLSGGSPCQGLSVAGVGGGLVDVRSILFYQQMRLWRETNAPYCLWENVPGALSSNKGADFAAIVSAFIGTTVACPTKSGRWPRAGIASGADGVAAWRVLDAQYFGVPQRRRRVFVIGARAGGADPGQILFEYESLRRYPAPRRGTREGTAVDAQDGVGSASIHDARGNGDGEISPTLAGDHQNRVTDYTAIVAPTLSSNYRNRSNPIAELDPISFHPTQTPISGDIAPSMGAESGPMGVVTFKPSHFTRGKDGGFTDMMPPLSAGHEAWRQQAVAGSLNAHESKDAHTIIGTLNGTQRQQVDGAMITTAGVPRRLMPVECERLMSWPDNWTLIEGVSDTPRYKACGNGVVSNVVQWIGKRLLAYQ